MDFSELVALYEKLESTPKRLEMTDYLAAYFKEVPKTKIRRVVYLIQGILVPEHQGVELGVADKLCMRAIANASGQSIKNIEAAFRKKGDLGVVAQDAMSKKTQTTLSSSELSVDKVYDNLFKVATASGAGSQDHKIKLLSELFSSSAPLEAKAIARFVTGSLRLGVAEPTIIDALSVWSVGDKSAKEDLERAFNLTSDLGWVAETLFEKGMESVKTFSPTPFHPIRPALAERLPSAEKIIEKLGTASVEAKYDGLRLQVHKKGDEVRIYSRRQENVTPMFPDVVAATKKQFAAKDAIFEGEAIGVDAAGKFVAFQETVQRKRKHGVAEAAQQIPLKLFCFELLYADGRDLTNEPYQLRREELEKRVRKGTVLDVAATHLVSDSKELETLFDAFVGEGLEGVMAKDLEAPYVAGARKFAWIKLKRSYASNLADSLDVVVIGFYYGKGKRTKFGFGGLLTAVYDESSNQFKSIAKIGTGFNEEQMSAFRELLEKDVVPEKPKNVDCLIVPDEWVKPKHVVTVVADELTRSPTHTAGWKDQEGLALRFPRLKGFVREDKAAKQATTVKEVLDLYDLQRSRSG
ncbi:ATP-dependent DNA ligase [Candidatus Micrarchaeota archaeon]|nr:ATP-dependent DNA ligase [Candidatus Micrarchaeota archaeon]